MRAAAVAGPDPGAPPPTWPDPVSEVLAKCTFPPKGTVITCAVSGGADSMALLVLAVAAGCEVTAVHVDHGLREASSAEAGAVEAVARRLGAEFRSEAVEVVDGPNLEARCRVARFSVLPVGAATGHTMDDQAETVLVNLLRGAGPDGLAGMRPGPDHPLLGVRRSETVAVCRALGIDPVVDPSNFDRRHLRNRVRHELLPLCGELARRDPVPVLARQAGLFAEEAEMLDALARRVVADPADTRELAEVGRPLARRALRTWLRSAGATAPSGGGAVVDRPYPPSLAEVDRVLAVAVGKWVV